MLFSIELQHFCRNFLSSLHHFAWVTHTTPCHIGDVQQTVDAAQVHERAVFGDVFNNTGNDNAFFQGFHQLGALFAHADLDHSATRQHNVVALAVKLDDLEFHGLVFVRREVFGGTHVDQRTWQKGADAVDQHGQAAFDFASGGAGDKFARLQRFFQRHP